MSSETSPVLETVDDYIEARLTHSIHTSERRSFRGCRRRWAWAFRHFYYPYETPHYFEFGIAFHKGMEGLYDPRTWDMPEVALANALTTFKRKADEQKAAFYKAVADGHILDVGDEDKHKYDEQVTLGIGMLKHYARTVIPKQDNEFTPVKVEIPFEVPIEDEIGNQLWCKCRICWHRFKKWCIEQGDGTFIGTDDARYNLLNREPSLLEYKGNFWLAWKGLPVTYGGRVDMLAKDSEGFYWPFDWKSAARMSGVDEGAEDDFMLWDDQVTSYCWALWKLGIPIKGFVYCEIRKAVPVEPEPNKTRRLNRLYSVNKQQTTTYELYMRTVRDNDTAAYEAGYYDEFLDYLREFGTVYHKRHRIHRNDMELAQAGYNIFLEALEMTSEDLALYPSPGRFSCGSCAFQQPCLGKNRGEDYKYTLMTQYDKRSYHYWEADELSTDKPGRG